MVLDTGRTLVLAPHADDETLGCGGMIALKRAAGASVHIVFLTDGGKKTPGNGLSENLAPGEYTRIRKCEALSATALLGIPADAVEFWEYPDGNLRHPCERHAEELIERFKILLQRYRPNELYVPHRHDTHPDHEATYELVQKAVDASGIPVRTLQYAIWRWWISPLKGTPRDLQWAWRLPIAIARRKKLRAILKYRSQTEFFPHGLFWRFFLPFELFYEVEPRNAMNNRSESDARGKIGQ